ncbi:MAG TPA: glycosyltransferase family A protein [Candidatus Dormibacteraeota bacterium]|nr:glycosyltransferase family A protein [Candidatus Dormibacteraeota bacterium]
MTGREVTAVVLSIGEPFVARALASLERQTEPPVDIVRVEGVSPFHRALNAGIARVRTAFFVHVDADMVLDPSALADLRACVAPGIGVVVGGLRDPLRGSIVGIKLYRTECAAGLRCPDSITPAVDFVDAIRARGWMTAHALAYRPGPHSLWHTFGEHQPDYTPLYTFTKFRLLGARYRHWRNGPSLRRMFTVLHESRHPAARIAQAGAATGVYWTESRDVLRPAAPSDGFALFQKLLDSPPGSAPMPTLAATTTPRQAFVDHYRAGCELARDGAASSVRALFDARAAEPTLAGWAALIGLCRGIFAPASDPARADADFQSLAELFPDGLDE